MFNQGNGYSLADIAAATNGGYGNGNGSFGGDGSWWIILLFLFFFGGWGNYGNSNGFGYGGMGGFAPMFPVSAPATQNDIQRSFDQSAIINSLSNINNGITTGFSSAEISRGNSQANILSTLANNQAATTASMNALAAGLQQCCCDNRAGLADLKYTVATENCADRTALSDGIRDILTATQTQTQAILDKMCQQEIDALKTQNANLQTQINLANLQASQTAQTARILADNAAQTTALEQYLNPAPIPAYVVQNPNCCTNMTGCGCGCGSF